MIRPVDYELQGVVRLLRQSRPSSEKGYLVESLWKYLVYTELAKTVYELLAGKPSHYERNRDEQELFSFVEVHREIVLPEFTLRMERMIDELRQVDYSLPSTQQRIRVSEVLHSLVLAGLREHLGRVLAKKDRVFILVDNLDKIWAPGEDLVDLSQFLFGLLGLAQVIPNEFQKTGVSWRPVNLSVLVFLRTDIFSYIMSAANEADKIMYSILDWNDRRLLQRVVEQRFVQSAEGSLQPEDVWVQFFSPTVDQRSTKDYLVDRVIPRPRDIIYWCKAALAAAINHGHTRIEEDDVLAGESQYSQHVFQSLVTEVSSRISKSEDLLHEFAGLPTIVTKDDVKQCLERAGVCETELGSVIDALCATGFLGLETGQSRFDFLYENGRKPVLQSLARKMAETQGIERFAIHSSYHSYLEIGKA